MMAKRIETHTEHTILECQNGFRRGRSCIDGFYTVKMVMQKKREFNLETHLYFINLEKAYDQVKREKLFNILYKVEVDSHLRKLIECIYDDNTIQIRKDKLSSEKPI